jgi:hypothetical protein
MLGLLLLVLTIEQSRWEAASLLELSGTMKWSVLFPVFGLGGVECHGSVRGSVRRLSGSAWRAERRTFPTTENGLLCWKSAAVTSNCTG